MKHKTLRTLLCVILTVCFCLSAIVPASAAGLFGGESGIASQWDQWIRSLKDLKDRIIEKTPGTDETPADPMTGTGEEFIRIFHLDCGRKYFTVAEIKGIIDQLAKNNYTHIELAFGNDGFRFLLDDMSVGKYTSDQVKSAIQAGNKTYAHAGELTETEMNTIIAYAQSNGIGVIPMIDVPGHCNALIDAMGTLGIFVNSTSTGNNSAGVSMRAFKAGDNDATKFVVALVEKYVDYFREKGSAYFNIAGDECGYSTSFVDTDALADNLFIPLVEYIKGDASLPMTPMMFNDGFRNTNTLADKLAGRGIIVCFWEMQTSKGYYSVESLKENNKFSVVNTHNKWYYVAGKENGNLNGGWSDYAYAYNWAISNMEGSYNDCTICDGDSSTDRVANTGCMLAFWCDDPGATVNYNNLSTYINKLSVASNVNKGLFTGNLSMPAKPAISGAPSSVQISDGTVKVSSSIAARWTSSNNSVITFEDAATKAAADSASYTETATARIVGAGTAIITATTANRGWSVQTVTVTNNGGTVDPGTEYEDRNVTVTAGGTATDTIIGTNYASGSWSTEDSNIATISVTGKDYEDGVINYTAESVSYGTLAGSNIRTYGKTDYYHKVGNNYYPVYAYRSYKNYGQYHYGYSITNGSSVEDLGSSWYDWETVTVYSQTTTPASPASTTITFTGAVGAASKTTYAIVGHVRYTINVTTADLSGVTPLPIQTWITTNAIETISKTSTGNSYWAANWAIGDNNGEAYYTSVQAAEVNSEEGKSIAELLPNNLLRYENGGTYWEKAYEGKEQKTLVVWSGRIHDASQIQKIYGNDYSNTGVEFRYIRYYGANNGDKKWQVSNDRKNWVTVQGTNSISSEQLAVYYMMRTKITAEVTTDVGDWGHTKASEYDTPEKNGQYVLLDFAVKYPSGTRNPNSFPVLDKTFSFHCDNNKANDANSPVFKTGNYYYRQLNNFRAIETNTETYELYMVTVTMTSDDPGTRLTASGTAYDLQSKYQYDGEEQVLWAIDQAALDATEMKPYKAITANDTTYSGCKLGTDGYEPYVRGVEVYEAHGALITYYIRPKVTQGALTVNYYVQDENTPFYSYNINVDANGESKTFKESIRLAEPDWKGPLADGDVTNILGQTECISADLTTMPAIGAQYRYSDFTCVKVERATDGKTVNLYYTFKADGAFVIDFGLPLTIPVREINAELANAQITKATAKGNLYGNVEFDVSQQSLIYTPTKPVDKIDIFKVTLEGTRNDASSSVIYTISIIPATNVYYEETFMTVGNGWTSDGTPAAVQQTIVKNGDITVITEGISETYNNVYGYDYNIANHNIDATNVTYSMDSAYKATLQLPEGSKFINTPGKLTFSFEGTGFDLISGCGANTGMLTVNVVNSQGSHVKTYVVDTYLHGDNTIMHNGTTTYQVPVVRNLNLGYDKYTVTVYGSLWSTSGAVVKSPVPNPTITQSAVSTNSISLADTANTSDILRAMLNECGLEDVSVDDVELVYMDENSVLNGGTGMDVVEEELSTASLYSLDAIADETAASTTAVVWVDAFRVYNPLGSSTASEAYTDDKEAGVQYLSLYEHIKDHYSSVPQENNSVLYIEYDGTLGIANITNYKNQGPENEVYLGPNSAIAFALNTTGSDSIAQISAKIVNGDPVLSIGKDSSVPLNATEMYYNLKTKDRVSADSAGNTYIVIKNTAKNPDAVLAVSGLKLKNATTSKPSEAAIAAIFESFAQSTGTTFEPSVFEVSAPQIARKNRNFGFGVTASAKDVETVTIQMVSKDGIDVDGEIVELTPSNMNAVASGFASDYFYSKVYRIKEKGTYTFAITAYGDGGDSKTITKTVVVK